MPVHILKGCLMVEMGFGDIMVATGARDGIEDEIVFIPGPQGEIGRTNPEAVGKSSDDLGAVCRIVFHKRESIDVVIEKLQELKSRWKPTPRAAREGRKAVKRVECYALGGNTCRGCGHEKPCVKPKRKPRAQSRRRKE